MLIKPRNAKQRGNAILSLFNCGPPSKFVAIERQNRKVRGIHNALVNHAAYALIVDYDPTQLTVLKIRDILANLSRDSVE